ncbi:tyrosine-type recombinase/integrase [Celeribacter halophilus]|uniref:tyrosine-type recombinase/integrase n=1 Tax=Celeribacter halophilus TaxID=576117 RepID=UPI003A9502C0
MEFEQLLEAARNDICPHIALILVVARSTGMRHGEILALKFKDIDWDGNRISIRNAKAGPRIQPISQHGIQALQAAFKVRGPKANWVFPSSTSKSGHITHVKSQWARVVQAADLQDKGYTLHTIRHTVITKLAEAGVGAAVIQKISGHKTIQMVHHYTHVGESVVDNALEKMSLQ